MKELIRKWNAFVENLIAARDQWETLREELREAGLIEFQSLPVNMQKGVPNVHSVFDVAVVRLIEKQLGYGALEDLLVKIQEEEEEIDESGAGEGRRGSAGRRSAK